MSPRNVTLDSCVNYAQRCQPPTWVHHAVHLQSSFMIQLEMIQIPDAHIPMNWRHDPQRRTSSDWLSLRPTRSLGLNPPAIKGGAALCVNRATIRGGWHCSGRAAASDVCRPVEVWRYHTLDDAATAGLFKGFIMVSARSIHIGCENIYPLWNGWSNNEPVVFKEVQSETAISSGRKAS